MRTLPSLSFPALQLLATVLDSPQTFNVSAPIEFVIECLGADCLQLASDGFLSLTPTGRNVAALFIAGFCHAAEA